MCASGMNATRHSPCANGGHLGSGQGLPSPVKQPTVAATSFTSAVCAVRGQHLSAIHIQPFGHGLLALHNMVWHCIELATPCDASAIASALTRISYASRGQHLSVIHIQPFGHGLLTLHVIVWHCIKLATPCRDTVFMRHTPNQFKGTTKSRCPATSIQRNNKKQMPSHGLTCVAIPLGKHWPL